MQLASNDSLADLVRRHKMTWHVRPEQGVVDGELVPIGFVVELTATHAAPAHTPYAGCDECVPVRRALDAVAHAVLPVGSHASWYDVHVAEGELEYDHGTPHLSATIAVLHKGVVNRPPDACERDCVEEIRARLRALGAREQ